MPRLRSGTRQTLWHGFNRKRKTLRLVCGFWHRAGNVEQAAIRKKGGEIAAGARRGGGSDPRHVRITGNLALAAHQIDNHDIGGDRRLQAAVDEGGEIVKGSEMERHAIAVETEVGFTGREAEVQHLAASGR